MNKLPFKTWFSAHQSITGSLLGLFAGIVFSTLNFPGSVFLIAPLFAGFIAGWLGGSGIKAGILTLVLPIIALITISLAFPSVDWTASTVPEVVGVGPINATMAALTNGLIRSTWGVASGLAAISSAISGVLSLIILIMIPILIVVGLGVTAILGFIGGKIGSVVRASVATHRDVTPIDHAPIPQPTPPR